MSVTKSRFKSIYLFLIILLVFPFLSYSSESSVSVRITPGISIPVGRDTELFSLGGGANLSIDTKFPSFPFLTLSPGVGYSYAPLNYSTSSLSLVYGGLGIGINLQLFPRLMLNVFGGGGYFYGFINETSSLNGSNPYVSGGAGLSFRLGPALSMDVSGSYRNFLGFYNDIDISLGASVYIGGSKPSGTDELLPVRPTPLTDSVKAGNGGGELSGIEFEPIFPVFYKYYDNNPIGRVVVRNNSSIPITNLKISLYVKQYMDYPKESLVADVLDSGGEQELEFYGLFASKILEISEGTKVSAQIILEYTKDNQVFTEEYIETLRIFNRNAITWDDDRKAAAFVTAKDNAIMKFSKNIAGIINDNGSRAVNKNLLLAIAIHETLNLYGMSYVIDPTTPYSEFSNDGSSVDYLQFPRQSMEFMAGDCDDLSILYASLLEAVGIETAFLTIPGHIFMAFSLDMLPDDARKAFSRVDNLILTDDKSWVPVEITSIGDGFLKAWQIGAKEWRENAARNQTGFFTIHNAWELYEPVGFPGDATITLPDRDEILNAYLDSVLKFIDIEIYPQTTRIQNELDKSNNQNNPRLINKLGVLYARYGLDEKAVAEFQRILADSEYVPALINMGNLSYLEEDMIKANNYYTRAQVKAPENPKVLLGVARVNHELENYGMARTAYIKLQEISPTIADRFAYLDLIGEESGRAADAAGIKGVVLWEEE